MPVVEEGCQGAVPQCGAAPLPDLPTTSAVRVRVSTCAAAWERSTSGGAPSCDPLCPWAVLLLRLQEAEYVGKKYRRRLPGFASESGAQGGGEEEGQNLELRVMVPNKAAMSHVAQ